MGSAALIGPVANAGSTTNAFTEENASSQGGTVDLDVDAADGDTVTAAASAANGAITVTARKSGGTIYTVTLKPATGQAFQDGTYDVTNSGTSTGPTVVISPAPAVGGSCSNTGTLDIADVALNGSTVTSLTASYTLTCSSPAAVSSGEIRIDSASGYELVTAMPVGSVQFGSAAVGVDATTTLTLHSAGTSPVSVGAPSITGSNAASFSLSDDTCSGSAVSPGSSCTVTVHFGPAAVQRYTAEVVYPADTAQHERDIFVAGSGALPPSAPINLTAIPGDDGVGLQWAAPSTPNGTVTGYNVYRDTGSGYVPATSLGEEPEDCGGNHRSVHHGR